MAVFIQDNCVCCGACSDICPNDAIIEKLDIFEVQEKKCDECRKENFVLCASICPIEECFVWGEKKPKLVYNKTRGVVGKKVDN